MIRMVNCIAVLALCSTGDAQTYNWDFTLNEQLVKNGPEPDGSTNSPGFGHGTVSLDLETNTVSYDISWEGLVGDLTKLHIHGPASAQESTPQHLIEIFGPPEVPLELVTTSGTATGLFQLQTLVQEGFGPVEPNEIIEAMLQGESYINVHTTVFGMGEIRGNLGHPVPEPGSSLVSVFGFACLFQLGRRSKRTIFVT